MFKEQCRNIAIHCLPRFISFLHLSAYTSSSSSLYCPLYSFLSIGEYIAYAKSLDPLILKCIFPKSRDLLNDYSFNWKKIRKITALGR